MSNKSRRFKYLENNIDFTDSFLRLRFLNELEILLFDKCQIKIAKKDNIELADKQLSFQDDIIDAFWYDFTQSNKACTKYQNSLCVYSQNCLSYYGESQCFKVPIPFIYISSLKTNIGLIILSKSQLNEPLMNNTFQYYYLSHPLDTYQPLYFIKNLPPNSSETPGVKIQKQIEVVEMALKEYDVIDTVNLDLEENTALSTLVLVFVRNKCKSPFCGYMLCNFKVETNSMKTLFKNYKLNMPSSFILNPSFDSNHSFGHITFDKTTSRHKKKLHKAYGSHPTSSYRQVGTPPKYTWDLLDHTMVSPSPTSMLSSLHLGNSSRSKNQFPKMATNLTPTQRPKSLVSKGGSRPITTKKSQKRHINLVEQSIVKGSYSGSLYTDTLTKAEQEILRGMGCVSDGEEGSLEENNPELENSLDGPFAYLTPLLTLPTFSIDSHLPLTPKEGKLFITRDRFISHKTYVCVFVKEEQQLYLLEAQSLSKSDSAPCHSLAALSACPLEEIDLFAIVEPNARNCITLYAGVNMIISLTINMPLLQPLNFDSNDTANLKDPTFGRNSFYNGSFSQNTFVNPGFSTPFEPRKEKLHPSRLNQLDPSFPSPISLDRDVKMIDVKTLEVPSPASKSDSTGIIDLYGSAGSSLLYTIVNGEKINTLLGPKGLLKGDTEFYELKLPSLPCRTSQCEALYNSLVQEFAGDPDSSFLTKLVTRWYQMAISSSEYAKSIYQVEHRIPLAERELNGLLELVLTFCGIPGFNIDANFEAKTQAVRFNEEAFELPNLTFVRRLISILERNHTEFKHNPFRAESCWKLAACHNILTFMFGVKCERPLYTEIVVNTSSAGSMETNDIQKNAFEITNFPRQEFMERIGIPAGFNNYPHNSGDNGFGMDLDVKNIKDSLQYHDHFKVSLEDACENGGDKLHIEKPTSLSISSRSRFPQDLRMEIAYALLDSSHSIPLWITKREENFMIDHNRLMEEMEMQLLSQWPRVLSHPFGRCAFDMHTSWPLLTQTLPVPTIQLSGHICVLCARGQPGLSLGGPKTQQPRRVVKVSPLTLTEFHNSTSLPQHLSTASDPNGIFASGWPYFHNGVASGLTYLPAGQAISDNNCRSNDFAKLINYWILFNKPKPPAPIQDRIQNAATPQDFNDEPPEDRDGIATPSDQDDFDAFYDLHFQDVEGAQRNQNEPSRLNMGVGESGATTRLTKAERMKLKRDKWNRLAQSHAGTLLGLGLGGHISNLSLLTIKDYLRWDALSVAAISSPSNTDPSIPQGGNAQNSEVNSPNATSLNAIGCGDKIKIAVLLGLAAGTYRRKEAGHRADDLKSREIKPGDSGKEMDVLIYRLLAMHLEAFLNMQKSPEDFRQSLHVQTAAMLSLGLIHCGTGHGRHVSKIALQEIAVLAPDPDCEHFTDRDSYSLAAGFALGLVNFGRALREGSTPSSALQKIQVTLLNYVLYGCSDIIKNDASKNPPDMSLVFPPAALALGFIFFRTNDRSISKHLGTPATVKDCLDIRPDFFMLRTIAAGLIHYDSIAPRRDWWHNYKLGNACEDGGSAEVRGVFRDLIHLADDREDEESPFLTAEMGNLRQIRNFIYAGQAFLLGLKYAGTHDKQAANILFREFRRLVVGWENLAAYYEEDEPTMADTDHVEAHKIEYVATETCVNTFIISLAMIMSGSGDTKTFKYCRKFLRPALPPFGYTVPSYGFYVCASTALALLFLGQCRYRLSNEPGPGLALLTAAFYPFKWPAYTSDNKYHFQPFRHLFALCTKPSISPQTEPKASQDKKDSREHLFQNIKNASKHTHDPTLDSLWPKEWNLGEVEEYFLNNPIFKD